MNIFFKIYIPQLRGSRIILWVKHENKIKNLYVFAKPHVNINIIPKKLKFWSFKIKM